MKNKIPPPIVTLFFGLCIYFSHEYFQEFNLEFLTTLSYISYIAGLSILVWAVRLFKKQNTTVNPIKIENASSLVVSGVFKYSRNPMYLGMLMIIISTSIFYLNIYSILTPFLFVFWINKFQIKREEIFLTEKFGKEYLSYKNKTRRWL